MAGRACAVYAAGVPNTVRIPDRVTEWVVAHVAGVEPPLEYVVMEAGRSNLTYRVACADGRSLVLRRPPEGPLAPTAHDVAREYRIVTAMARSEAVPVPEPLALCEDRSVLDAPFHVMSFVEGRVLHGEVDAAGLAPEVLRAATCSLVSVLARMHALEPRAIGLETLGRHDGYLDRQLARWGRQYHAATSAELAPVVQRLGDELVARAPAQQRTSVVHGDYRLDNLIFDDRGDVHAVLDWELCALGDALADLGLLLTYWGPDDGPPPVPSASSHPGFPDRSAVVDAYAARTALDLSDLAYYVAFGHWKLACILDGVFERRGPGAAPTSAESVAHYPETVRSLATRGRAILHGEIPPS